MSRFRVVNKNGLQHENGNPHWNTCIIIALIVELEKNGIRMKWYISKDSRGVSYPNGTERLVDIR